MLPESEMRRKDEKCIISILILPEPELGLKNVFSDMIVKNQDE